MFKFIEKYRYILIIVLLLAIIYISYINYQNTERIIKDKYKHRQQLVENSIIKTFNHVNDAYNVAEQQLNTEMRKYSLKLRDKYIQNPDIYSWDLDKLKDKFGGYDIYIIDRDLTVIRSTLEEDIGLDFKQFTGFSKIIRKRLEGDSFAVDRLDLETNTGKIKKYSYMPTPDNKYLLELSADIKKIFPTLESLNFFAEANDLEDKYMLVNDISFYKYSPETKDAGVLRSTKNPVDTDIPENIKEYVGRAFESKETQRVERSEGLYSAFIPALVEKENNGASWWNSFVVGITYDNAAMMEEISTTRSLFFVNGLIMVGIFILFIMIVIYLLKKFEYMAYHDQLTGLPNRKSFMEKTAQMMEANEKNRKKLAVMFIDINKFKQLNDNFGHDVGDKVLASTAEKLKSGLREGDYVSRLGGDEFTIALSGITSRKEVEGIARRIIQSFQEPIEVNSEQFFISISIGISIYPDQGRELEELIKKADHAMYEAKQESEDYILYNL